MGQHENVFRLLSCVQKVVLSGRVFPCAEGDIVILKIDLPVVEHEESRVERVEPHTAHGQVRLRFLHPDAKCGSISSFVSSIAHTRINASGIE